MKILYLDCPMGAAGDMLCSALWELVDDKQNTIEEITDFLMPEISVAFEEKTSFGMVGTHMSVRIKNEIEGAHRERHIHRTLGDIENIIDSLPVDKEVSSAAMEIYKLIATAEARVHNTDNYAVHFHEVGTLDAVSDITVFCYLLKLLDVDKVIASPINTGKGTVKCAHGILPVPAPATAELLKGMPAYSNDVSGELCTPTGAAIIKYFADEFSDMPEIIVNKIGVGFGTKELDRPNCIRAFLGESAESSNALELSCNIDDMTGEELGYAAERLLGMGALDVTLSPVIMKKGRPAIELKLLCAPSDKDKFIYAIFKYTSTIGIRLQGHFRYTLEREFETRINEAVSYKVKHSYGYGSDKKKVEYEDVKKYADEKNISFSEARRILENQC